MSTDTSYDHKKIAQDWAERWLKHRTYEPNLEKPKNPFYNLMMFPYPSAEGLHVGNMYAFSGADIYGRFQRMQGKDVLEPIGLDGFGIHSENYAIKIGKHPVEQAKKSQENFYRQLSMIGNGFAWEERLETYDPAYYRWTQWLFIQMFKNGLAYKATASVNWCPSCKTVLADEQVEDGLCERCKSVVERKDASQWFFKITDYADRLLANIDSLKWPEKIKIAQRQWIGKSSGLSIPFKVDPNSAQAAGKKITVWTKFWETIYGVTYLVLAPEHPLALELATPDHKKELEGYIEKALNKTEQQRKVEEKQKSGVFTGSYVINPVSGEKVPVWVADYVLKNVGTGAVMGVPSHDERDFDFAKKHGLRFRQVVSYADRDINAAVRASNAAHEGEGTLVNSGEFDGQSAWGEGKVAMKKWLIKKHGAKEELHYHLRDWLISRQRFWGPPIPMLDCPKCGWQPVPEDQLPVELPFIEEYKPTGDGMSPLERADETWLYSKCPQCGGKAKRETDVSDTFLDSSWYFLRYPSLHAATKDTLPFDPTITKAWLPVHAYIGGAEHAVLHLLYSRFVMIALKDWGYVEVEEPFPFLFGHGLIIKDGSKMSKSKGNVVNPDEYIEKFGADTLRTYLMFLGPYDQGGDFRDSGIAGMHRWLQKVWSIVLEKGSTTKKSTPKVQTKLHRTIKKCTEDMAKFKFNTSIAALMECVNEWSVEGEGLDLDDTVSFLKLLAPFAPYMTEELYHNLVEKDESKSIHTSAWPTYEEKLTIDENTEVVVQISGKVRARVSLNREVALDKDKMLEAVMSDAKVIGLLAGKEPSKTIAVPGKLVNIVL